MLLNLHVKNFAIIKQINIDFNEGLNILTGETGSGKSLLLKTLNLLRGDRFSKEYLGIFDDKTFIEGVFLSTPEINDLLAKEGFEVDENIILTRTLTKNTSISKINNQACNIKFMSMIADKLFNIHGQHSQLVILDRSNYISIIDRFDNQTIEIKNKLKENLLKISKLSKENEELNLSDDEIEREKDILSYQINEIEDFNFKVYNEESLNKEYKKLSNQVSLIEGTDQALEIISKSIKNTTLRDLSTEVYNILLSIEKYDEDLKSITSEALNIRELVNDLSNSIYNYSNTLEIDNERLNIIEDQFSKLQSLRLKYGRNIEDILSFLDKSKQRFEVLNDIVSRRNKISSEINKINLENKELATNLTQIRRGIIHKLEKKIISELLEMNMDNIDFSIKLTEISSIKPFGADDIDFLISTNKGQELKSLSNVSSGGEISRFMLALKASLIDKEDISTIIFDEIDTGISGKTAYIVGDKIKKISQNTQLLVISHLPQIASKADSHYLLFKEVVDEITTTNIQKLDTNGKIMEIARLISGVDITQKSIDSAIELLKEKK